MSNIPEQLKYAATHEWVKLLDDQTVQVGITDFAQSELGDLVYVELPVVGRQLAKAEQCAVVESVKTASDLYSPVSGVVLAVNPAVKADPWLVNDGAYAHWLFTLQVNDPAELSQLLDADGYRQAIND